MIGAVIIGWRRHDLNILSNDLSHLVGNFRYRKVVKTNIEQAQIKWMLMNRYRKASAD